MRQTYLKEGKDRFMIRLPEGMRDQLTEAASANKRTISAEIVARLEESLTRGNIKFVEQTFEERLQDVENDIAILKAAVLFDKDKIAASIGNFTMTAELYKDEFKHLIPTKK